MAGPMTDARLAFLIEVAPGKQGLSPQEARELVAEVQRLRRVEKEYEANFPCVGCNINTGPEEECPRHGRSPKNLWEMLNEEVQDHRRTQALIGNLANTTARERDEAQARVKELEALTIDYLNRINALRSILSTSAERLEGAVEADTRWAERDKPTSDLVPGDLSLVDVDDELDPFMD